MREMAAEADTQKLVRELKLTRIVCTISCVLAFCLLAGGILLAGKVKKAADALAPLAEAFAEMDVEELNESLENLNGLLKNTDWQQTAEMWNQLDLEAINSALEGLDTKELSETLEKLNNAMEKFEELGEKLSSFTSLFGGDAGRKK